MANINLSHQEQLEFTWCFVQRSDSHHHKIIMKHIHQYRNYFPPTNASSIKSSSVIHGEPDLGEGMSNEEGDLTICIVTDGDAGNIGGAITRSVTVFLLMGGSEGGTLLPEKSSRTSADSNDDDPLGGAERDSSILARAVSNESFLLSSLAIEKSLGLSDIGRGMSAGLLDLKSSLEDEGTIDNPPRTGSPLFFASEGGRLRSIERSMESLLELPPPPPMLAMLPIGVIVRPGIGDPSVGVLLSNLGRGEGVNLGLDEEE